MPRLNTKKKAHNLEPEQEALLLLSWAQKLATTDTSGSATPTQLKRHHAAQIKAYRVFRAQCEAKVLALGAELRQTVAEKKDDEAALRAAPESERAQEAYRVMVQEVERIRAEIERNNRLLDAGNPTVLGGYVDLPIENYPDKLGLGKRESDYGMEDVYTVLIGLLVTTLGVLALLYLFLWSKEVRFECVPTDIPTGRVVLRMYNEVEHPVSIIAPLDTFSIDTGNSSPYGIELWVREKGGDFQLVNPPDNAWTYQGTPTRNLAPLNIAPKLTAELSLSLKALEKDFPKLDGYRIIAKSRRGLEVSRFEQQFMR